MSVVRINVQPDTLDDENRKFAQRPLAQPLFLNSVPKSGSHLLRNIIRMFVPVESQYQAEFIQHHFIQHHLTAFDPRRNMLSWGHLFFMEQFKALLANVRQVVLVRDPYHWVLAQARFVASNEFQVPGLDDVKRPDVPVESILNLVIEGRRPQLAPLAITYHYNAVAWLDQGMHLVRYEELVGALRDLDATESEAYFRPLLQACGIERPDDWRDRVRIGSDRKQSGTARENLTGVAASIPAELPDEQKRMVDVAYPGLRARLGYQ
jgi:hypothetical protein